MKVLVHKDRGNGSTIITKRTRRTEAAPVILTGVARKELRTRLKDAVESTAGILIQGKLKSS